MVKTERGRQKSNRDEDLIKRYDQGNIHVRERERKREREGGGKERLGPNSEQQQGISLLQRGMQRYMGEVGIG